MSWLPTIIFYPSSSVGRGAHRRQHYPTPLSCCLLLQPRRKSTLSCATVQILTTSALKSCRVFTPSLLLQARQTLINFNVFPAVLCTPQKLLCNLRRWISPTYYSLESVLVSAGKGDDIRQQLVMARVRRMRKILIVVRPSPTLTPPTTTTRRLKKTFRWFQSRVLMVYVVRPSLIGPSE